ncbi:hypothetical protein FRB98_001020 [Tulasnella sp. 332]|nr:hypothetical protein FRB98_001020 [Tulasnella sp. 332]
MEMLARPLLFREIRIYEPDYGAMSGVRRVERLDKFVDAVVSNPRLGTLVHSMEWNFPHERTFDMLPLLHNLQELTIWSSANQEKWEHPVDPVDFPLLTRLHVSGGYKPGGLGALVLRAPNLAALRIDSDTFEFGLGTRQVDPNTIQHLVEKCQQVDPPSLQSVVELYLEKMDPGFRLLNPLVEYLAPQIRTLKLARDRTRDILKNVSWENGLLSLMTSHRWTSLEHLHAVDWTLSTSVQNQIRSTCPDVHVSFEPERQSSSAENSGIRLETGELPPDFLYSPSTHHPDLPRLPAGMAIKYLDPYLQERRHLQTLPLSALSDTRLGIDASHYLRILLESPATSEPLLAATGGLPLALTSKIESDLRILEKLRIKPVFVFPGLLVANKKGGGVGAGAAAVVGTVDTKAMMHADACADRKAGWAQYEEGNTDEAARLFTGKTNLAQWDLWRSVLRIFRNRNVEYMVAPYAAWAQLIYLQKHQKSYVHAIYGPTEALLYPSMDRIITALDLIAPQPTFTFVVKRAIVSDLGLTEDQFLDVGILAGFDRYSSLPTQGEGRYNFKYFVEMVKRERSGWNALHSQTAEHAAAVKQSNYSEQFARAKAMVKNSLIMSSEGLVTALPLVVQPTTGGGHQHHHSLTAADIPQDLNDVFTNRLPDEIYFYLSRGLIGPQALVWLTSGQIIEPPPLDNGETNEYRRFVKEVITEGATGPRATALALVGNVCNTFWANRRVTAHFWFEHLPPNNAPNPTAARPIPHSGTGTMQLVERVSGWSVPISLIEEELRRQNSSTIDFGLCLGATSGEKLAARTKVKANPAHPLDKKDEVVANVIWRFLELRGFLLHTHLHSALARAMHGALQTVRINDKFQDPLYLFLELVRAGVMHGNLWSSGAFSGGPMLGLEEDKKCMLLIMRVVSILPLTFKAQPWEGPLSRELLVFNAFVRSLSRALRTLIELTALNTLLQHHARRARDDLLDISLSLPFQTDVNTGYGILAKVYLDGLFYLYGGKVVDGSAEEVVTAKQEALDFCDDTFVGVRDPKSEVLRGFRFWDACLSAIRSLAAEKQCLPDLAEQFEAAQRWLAPMRP